MMMDQQFEAREYDDYLSNKLPALSAVGTRLSDLYYNLQNSSVEVLESTCNWSMKINLTSTGFGSTNQINMPMSSFIGQLVLHLRLPAPTTNQSLCRGWGLNMIQRLRFQFGTSASTPIILSKQAIWHALFSQCYTEEKRSAMFRLCGEQWTQPPLVPVGADAVTYVDAYVPLPVPFSYLCEKLMYDSTILGQPITVYLDFETNPRLIYGGSDAVPTSFQQAELMIRQQQLADMSKSLRNIMQVDPSVLYSYPFTMALGFETVGPFNGVRESDGGQCTVQFNQFQNGDLLGIVFCVQAVGDITPSSNNTPNPFHCDPIKNVSVTYNGGMIFQLPAQSYRAIATYMGDQQDSSYWGSYVQSGAGPVFNSAPVQEYLIWLDFTNFRAICHQSHLSNDWRIPPGNVLQVAFNTQFGSSTQYRCYYTTFYNSIVTAQGGVSNVWTA